MLGIRSRVFFAHCLCASLSLCTVPTGYHAEALAGVKKMIVLTNRGGKPP